MRGNDTSTTYFNRLTLDDLRDIADAGVAAGGNRMPQEVLEAFGHRFYRSPGAVQLIYNRLRNASHGKIAPGDNSSISRLSLMDLEYIFRGQIPPRSRRESMPVRERPSAPSPAVTLLDSIDKRLCELIDLMRKAWDVPTTPS